MVFELSIPLPLGLKHLSNRNTSALTLIIDQSRLAQELSGKMQRMVFSRYESYGWALRVLKNVVISNIARLRASRCLKYDPGAVKCGIGNSDVTSDMYSEPTKLAIDPILSEDVEHT